MASKEFAKYFKKLGKAWKTAKAEAERSPQFDEVDDGVYIARVTDFELRTSEAGNFGMLTSFTIVRGENKGLTIRRWDGLQREEGLPFVIRFLKSLGVETDDLEPDGIEDAMKPIVKERPAVRIRVKTKGEFQNIYVQKLLGEIEDEDEDEPEVESDGADDAPAEDDGGLDVGAEVTVQVGKKTKTGVVKSIAPGGGEGSVLVKFEDGSKGNFDPDDLTLVQEEEEEEEEEEEAEPEPKAEAEPEGDDDALDVGDSVTWGKGKEGVIISVDGDEVTVRQKKTRETFDLPRSKVKALVA